MKFLVMLKFTEYCMYFNSNCVKLFEKALQKAKIEEEDK